MESWVKVGNAFLPSGNSDGVALTNSAVKTDISPGANVAGRAFTIGSDCPLLTDGSLLRISAAGTFGAAAAQTLTLAVYYGGSAATALASTGALKTATVTSPSPWDLSLLVRVVKREEAVGKAFCIGHVHGLVVVGSTTVAASVSMLPEAASGEVGSLDFTKATTLTLAATWGGANASNTITCHHWLIETLTAPT